MLARSLLALALILSSSLSSELYAQSTSLLKVNSVKFMLDEEALSPEREESLSSVLGFRVGNSYSDIDFIEGIRRIEDVFPYKVVKWDIDQGTGLLRLVMRTKSRISSVAVNGNKHLSLSKIMDNIGDRLIGYYCEDLCEPTLKRLQQFYKDQGFYNSTIEIQKNYEPGAKVELLININEGESTTVKEFDLEVDGFITADRIKSLMGIKIGDRLVASEFNQKIRDLRGRLYSDSYYSSRFFKNSIKISEDKAFASIELGLSTGPKFTFDFIGNDTFSNPSTLRKALDINETDVLSREYYPVLIKRLEDFYRSYGFSEAKINVQEELGSRKGEVLLSFKIEEGAQKYIGRLNFNVQDKKIQRKLLDYIRDNKSDLFTNGYFISKEFEDIKGLIERFFNEEGYLRIKVIGVNFKDRGPHKVDIDYDLDIGRPTIIRTLEVNGNTLFSDQEVIDKLSLVQGGSVYIPSLSDGIDKLTALYREKGYVDFYLDKEKLFSYSDDFRFVDINVSIKEGGKYRVGRIFVEGLESTKHRVVTRELSFKEGDEVDLYQVRSSENALSSLSIFRSASVIVLPSSVKGQDYRDIMVKLEEKKAGIYEIAFGYRTDQGLKVSTNVTYHNLGGWNRRVYAGGSVSRRLDNDFRFMEYEINVGYYEPYLFEIPFDFRIDVDFKKEDFPDYGRKKLDIAFYFEKQIGHNYLTLRQAFERVNIFDAKVIQDESIYWKYSIRPSYRFDNRDSFFNPTKGINFLIYGEWGTSLKSDVIVNYIKFVQRTRTYVSFLRAWTFVTAFDTGYIKGLKGDSILQDERFSLGGIDSIRGYRWKIINDTTPKLPYQYYYTFTLELRRKLFWRFVGSVFHDYGNIYSQDASVQGPFSSVGTGISIVMPVGSISLQYGYIYEPSKRIPADKFGRIHLSIGTF